MACYVRGCYSHSSRHPKVDNEGEHISFHKFPNKEDMKQKWIEILGRPKQSSTKNRRICSKHFLSHCFSYTQDQKIRRLDPDAVPTLFIESDDEDVVQSTSEEERIKATNEVGYPQKQPSSSAYCPRRPPTLPKPRDTYALIAHIEILEKKLEKARKTSQKRLLKINSLRQRTRRLKKNNVSLHDKLGELLEKEKLDT